MATFLIPIEGLTLPEAWQVGQARVRPVDEALVQLRTELSGNSLLERFEELVRDRKVGSFAEVDAPDRDRAIEVAARIVDVLRVFQHVNHSTVRPTLFGLAGDVGAGLIPYAELGERPGHGYMHRGEHLGWTFQETRLWTEDSEFQWVGDAIDESSPSESQRRALVAVQLLSQAIVEQRATFKMVAVVTALEALLLQRQRGAQTFRLARAVSYFGCGRPNDDLCGRSRDTCPFLGLDPGKDAARRELQRLRELGNTDLRWRCSEWHRVVDWYDDRSAVVHGAGPEIEYDEARRAQFWVLRYLLRPMLEWLAGHPRDPIAALDAELASLPPMPDWEAIIGTE